MLKHPWSLLLDPSLRLMEYFARYYRNTVRELQRPTAANNVAPRFTCDRSGFFGEGVGQG